jgi:hypothetical protein
LVLHDLRNAGAVGIGFVDSDFSGDPDTDNEGDGHSDSEADNIDQGVTTVPAKLAEGEEEIASEHALGLRIQQNSSEKSACFLRFNNQLVAIPLILLIVRFRTLYVQFYTLGISRL